MDLDITVTAETTYSEPKGDMDEKNYTDHLLVLVHGILASETLRNAAPEISFLAHSLGGLFARYAVAVLDSPIIPQASDDSVSSSVNSLPPRGGIAGLEPIDFITLATPHLRCERQKPGSSSLVIIGIQKASHMVQTCTYWGVKWLIEKEALIPICNDRDASKHDRIPYLYKKKNKLKKKGEQA